MTSTYTGMSGVGRCTVVDERYPHRALLQVLNAEAVVQKQQCKSSSSSSGTAAKSAIMLCRCNTLAIDWQLPDLQSDTHAAS